MKIKTANVTIRDLNIGDERGLVRLMRQLRGEVISLEMMQRQVQEMKVNMAVIGREVCLIAIFRQKMIGFGRAVFSLERESHIVNIRDFIVDEKFRGNGIGTKLFRKLLASLDHRNVTQARVKTSNPAAIAVCKKLGFFRKRGQRFFIRNYPAKKCA